MKNLTIVLIFLVCASLPISLIYSCSKSDNNDLQQFVGHYAVSYTPTGQSATLDSIFIVANTSTNTLTITDFAGHIVVAGLTATVSGTSITISAQGADSTRGIGSITISGTTTSISITISTTIGGVTHTYTYSGIRVSGGTGSTGTTGSTGSNDTAYVKFVNASPTETYDDVFDGHSSTTVNISGWYFEEASDFRTIATHDTKFTVKNGSGTVLTSPQLYMLHHKAYSFFIFDTFPIVKYVVIKDTIPTAASLSSHAAVKFVNVSPDAGPISYRIKGGATLATNVKYAGTDTSHCYTAYVSISTGYQNIEVLDANTSQVIDSMINVIAPTAGKSYTIFTGGYRNKTGNNAIKSFYTWDKEVQ